MNSTNLSLGRIDAQTAQPLYLQIKDSLKQRILDGGFAPHERLPSESNLMKSFSVSRITVRQALRDLHREGLIFSVQGKGSFVAKHKVVQEIQRLEGFGEAMAPKGYETSTKVLAIQELRPNQEVIAALRLQHNERVLEVRRIRYLNIDPVSLDISYFPLDIGSQLLGRDLAQDIFPMLENEFGISLDTAELKVGAIGADVEMAEYLKVEAGDPLLRIQRLVRDKAGRPVDFEYLSYRGDVYQYQFSVQRR